MQQISVQMHVLPHAAHHLSPHCSSQQVPHWFVLKLLFPNIVREVRRKVVDFWISIDDYARLYLLKVLVTQFRAHPNQHEICVLLQSGRKNSRASQVLDPPRCQTIPPDIWEPFWYCTIKGMVWSWLRTVWKVAGYTFISWKIPVLSALSTVALVLPVGGIIQAYQKELCGSMMLVWQKWQKLDFQICQE